MIKDRFAVMVTINPESDWDPPDWMDQVFEGRFGGYGSHRINYAYGGQKMLFYYVPDKAIIGEATITETDDICWFESAKLFEEVVGIEDLRKMGLMPNQTIRYVTAEQYKKITRLSKAV